tara:strand:- start:14534 stop:15808 length:1275 start_codon:yes stop_codon:yes gene_type:complete
MSDGVEKWAVHNQIIKNIDDLIPYDTNPREHAPKQINQVAKSIQEFGWTMPILIDEKNEIIAGHGRLLAGKQLGFTTVPCIVAKGWTEEQKKAYCIADNKLTENSTWKYDELRLNMEFLNDSGFDLTKTGFSFGEINRFIPDFNVFEGKIDENFIPEPLPDPISKLGDIWVIGNHRLMCGDSTSKDDLDSLMNGSLADMVFTDPPWNVDFGNNIAYMIKNNKYKERGIKNDSMTTEEFSSFLDKAFDQMSKHSKPGCPTYVVMSSQEWGANMLKLAENDYHWSSTIIWNKHSHIISRKDYNTKYEPIWYGWLNGAPRLKPLEDMKQNDVWDFDRPTKSDLHPTMKPVDLVGQAIKNSSEEGDLTLDLFGGAGSTMLASHKNKRVNNTMELDPIFVDVIIRRLQEYTGDNAVLESTGELFNDLLK